MPPSFGPARGVVRTRLAPVQLPVFVIEEEEYAGIAPDHDVHAVGLSPTVAVKVIRGTEDVVAIVVFPPPAGLIPEGDGSFARVHVALGFVAQYSVSREDPFAQLAFGESELAFGFARLVPAGDGRVYAVVKRKMEDQVLRQVRFCAGAGSGREPHQQGKQAVYATRSSHLAASIT